MRIRILMAGMMACTSAVAQHTVPADAALEGAMSAAQLRAQSVLQAMPDPAMGTVNVPDLRTRSAQPMPDPAALAQRYQPTQAPAPAERRYPVMVFASLSMPEATLKRIGQQARRAGAAVIFRGLRYGMGQGNWKRSVDAMKPVTDTGAVVLIDPRQFERFDIRTVPVVVVSLNALEDCAEGACANRSARVDGDVSLDYALERVAVRKDGIGQIARQVLGQLRGERP
ncbi:type-F conjugative transfer system pilin assembly protein TrbC [Cupriavidus sp. YAF13]|uniref:type-F conjugative transfer system pilin assembly protein TrbC n=1 Tax=Cupriavidus sp. YAF13 TaxID=3233075 RepID=UPI003F932F4D